jgi:hypothetical protein
MSVAGQRLEERFTPSARDPLMGVSQARAAKLEISPHPQSALTL